MAQPAARKISDVAPIVARMRLLKGNSIEVMRNWEGEPPQVIYPTRCSRIVRKRRW